MSPADGDVLQHDRPSENAGIAPSGPGFSRWTIGVVATTLALIFMAMDFGLPTAIQDDGYAAPAAMGFFAGQIALIALYAALGSGNIVVRLSWAVFLSLMTWYCVILGIRGTDRTPRGGAIAIGVVLAEGILLLQIPLSIAKIWRHWRISRDPYGSVPSMRDRQYGAGHLLLAMLLLSVGLSPLNIVLPVTDTPLEIDPNILFWIVFLIIPESITLLPVAIPTIGIAFSRTNAVLVVFFTAFFGFALSVVEIAGLYCLIPARSSAPPADKVAEALFGFCAFNMAQCMTIGIVVWIFRQLGFRLHRRSTEKRLPQPIAD